MNKKRRGRVDGRKKKKDIRRDRRLRAESQTARRETHYRTESQRDSKEGNRTRDTGNTEGTGTTRHTNMDGTQRAQTVGRRSAAALGCECGCVEAGAGALHRGHPRTEGDCGHLVEIALEELRGPST